MAKLQKVIRTELHHEVNERVTKTKRHDYSRGGFKLEETIFRVTTENFRALLECGHWREEHHSGPIIKTAKRLTCYECERIEREKSNEK